MVKVGIVILNYKDEITTKKLCTLIEGYINISHIVIVDNLSPDNSFEKLLKLQSSKIDVIQTDKNGGYSYGNNFGAFYLMDKYNVDVIFIANPDVEFSSEFVDDLVASIMNDEVDAVSGIMLDEQGNVATKNFELYSLFQEIVDSTIFLKRLVKHQNIYEQKQDCKYIYVDTLPGSLFAVDAKVFRQIGGFDESVFLFFEEGILRKRFDKYGYRMALLRKQKFYHMHSVSINKSMARINQYKQLCRSRQYFFENYMNCSWLELLLLRIASAYGIFARSILWKFFS